jgi:hypothetical protein
MMDRRLPPQANGFILNWLRRLAPSTSCETSGTTRASEPALVEATLTLFHFAV